MRRSLRTLAIGCGAAAVFGSVAALAFAAPTRPTTPPSPVVAMEKLGSLESTVKSGDIRYTSQSVSMRWDGEVDEAEGRAELARAGKEFGKTVGRLRFSGSVWREDGTFTSAAGVSTQLVSAGGDRSRREISSAGSKARVTVTSDLPAPANLVNAVLRSRLSEALKGVAWQAAEPAQGGLLRLRTMWLGRGLTLVLDPQKGHRPVTLSVKTVPKDELAPSSIQTIRIEYSATGNPASPSSVEEFRVYRLGDGAAAALLNLKVESASLNVDVPESQLVVRIPRGAEVTDYRAGKPVRYPMEERELTLTEVKELAEERPAAQASANAAGPKLGGPAPPIALKALSGVEASLQDYRGKVVLLNWFASW